MRLRHPTFRVVAALLALSLAPPPAPAAWNHPAVTGHVTNPPTPYVINQKTTTLPTTTTSSSTTTSTPYAGGSTATTTTTVVTPGAPATTTNTSVAGGVTTTTSTTTTTTKTVTTTVQCNGCGGGIFSPFFGTVVTTVNTSLTTTGTQTVATQTFVPPPPAEPLPQSVTPAPTQAGGGDVEARVQDAANRADQAIDQCQVNQANTPPCVADALDALADALEQLSPQLPPQLRTLPGIVRTAARKVRAAKTRGEAIAALKTAIAQVHKSIELLKASDPPTRQVGAREGGFVVQTLEVATTKLEKATGL